MNSKKAKVLRRFSKFIFAKEKKNGNENFKDIQAGTVMWIENTGRKRTTEEQDYALVQAFDANGQALKNEDGSPHLTQSPKVNDNGEPVMRKVEWAPGTISVHPACERGIYRKLKKASGKFTTKQIAYDLQMLQLQEFAAQARQTFDEQQVASE